MRDVLSSLRIRHENLVIALRCEIECQDLAETEDQRIKHMVEASNCAAEIRRLEAVCPDLRESKLVVRLKPYRDVSSFESVRLALTPKVVEKPAHIPMYRRAD